MLKTLRCLERASRSPALRDKVILADSTVDSLKGLGAGEVVCIVQHDKSDPETPYQVLLSDNTRPWFKVGDLKLADPLSKQPPPWRPERNSCCGSSCEDCVWIVYRKEVKAWNLSKRNEQQLIITDEFDVPSRD
jgi:hypothetical protein